MAAALRLVAEEERHRQPRMKRLSQLLILWALLAPSLCAQVPERSAQELATLQEILGSNPLSWKFSQPGKVEKLDGRAVFCSGTQGITISGSEQLPVDVEYRLVWRMTPPAGVPGASLDFRIGLKGPSDPNPNPPGVHFVGIVNPGYVRSHVADDAKGWRCYPDYYLKAVTTPSLAWPEALRKTVEADMARLPDLNHKWLIGRYVVRRNSIAVYLDDRLIDVRSEKDLDPAGSVRLVLSPHVAIASLQIRPLPMDDPIYRPVNMEGLLNASAFNEKPMDRATLPPSDQITLVDNTPFLFPRPDFVGNDHISLARSWAQFGALEGYFGSNHGGFGGRWPTALMVNPARIQFRVPNDHYTRLHLIAAADDTPDSVPIVTAQFFKAASGYPESFQARVPLFSARAAEVAKLSARLQEGRSGSLYHVIIDLDPGRLSRLGKLPPREKDTKPSSLPPTWRGDLAILEMELTKEVKPYRAYPDPCIYSTHQAGLPSSVHIYAMTLERAPLRLAFEPDKFGAVWTVPAVPAYTATLGNRTAVPRAVELTLSTTSHDGSEKTEQKQKVAVPPGDQDVPVKFTIPNLKRFGYHEVTLTMKDVSTAAGAPPSGWVERRSLARLQTDTRERGNWEEGRGPILGFWRWGGGHETPNQVEELQVMGEAGAEVLPHPLATNAPPEVVAVAQQYRMVCYHTFEGGAIYALAGAKPEEGEAKLLETLRKMEAQPGPINKCRVMTFFPEPGIGMCTYMNYPEYYGEPDYQFTPQDEERYKMYLEKFLFCARAIRKTWPNVKFLLPHGDPGFCIPFLRRSEEARKFIDGVGIDMPQFERMPEMQLHQVTQHRLYQTVNEFHKYGKKPWFDMLEGMCVPSHPGSLSWDEQGDILARTFLNYFTYGVYSLPAANAAFDCADYWGEEHYGGGWCSRLPYASPKPAYVGYATLSRHLNRANFEKWLPTGSGSVYALQFKHYQSGKLIHVFWTIRGKRPVTLTALNGAAVTVFDLDDNPTALTEKDGKVTFAIDSSPRFVEGLKGDPTISLGEPDHSDSKPAEIVLKLGNLGDGGWKISEERDLIYENNHVLQVARFPGRMSLIAEDAPKEQGGKALAVHLGKQDKERKVMPFYTTLVPKRPIVIPGKASHLGLWVRAASDWGRVVYCLRDAKEQRWVSIGTKDSWNCDDTHSWSAFCFDGWRYLRFEMPASSPYDSYREIGTTWWGHHGPGEGVVNLPLRLEKIIVERRTHTMYVNDPQPAKPDDVLLGDLMAEYASDFDRSDAVVRQSRLRMPAPKDVAGITNPIKDLESSGVAAPVAITKVEPPTHEYDGTRCHVHFGKSPAAVTYDVWVSAYPDGSGAIKLGTAWKEPGQLITGLRPAMDFYAFVTYTDKDGKASKPSQPFKFMLQDLFPMK
jgi:hypothetical protein